MRKRFPAFGHGDFRMLFPSNNKVLAFTRTYETQTILVVINLARFTQAVELDLQPWVGWTSRRRIRQWPVSGDSGHALPHHSGPTTFYWLLLTPPEAGSVPTAKNIFRQSLTMAARLGGIRPTARNFLNGI